MSLSRCGIGDKLAPGNERARQMAENGTGGFRIVR